jgi:NPCBM/NEW2 domain/Domain of unknown function (DUF1929)
VKSSSRDAVRSLLQAVLLGGMLLTVGCNTDQPSPLDADNPYLSGNFPWQSSKPLVKNNLKRGENPLSDLTIVSAKNGWGPLERDHSNGSESDGDGSTITLNGKTYSKGLGVHAPSELQFDLNGNCVAFSSDIGLDEEINSQTAYGTVIFKVLIDGVEKFNSGVMQKKQVKSVQLDFLQLGLTGAKKLVLKVEPGSDNNWFDHANWANPTLSCMVESAGSSAGFNVGSDAANKGTFGPLQTNWPTIAVHTAMLPSRKVLTWLSQDTDGGLRDDTGVAHSSTKAWLWNPDDNKFTEVFNSSTDIFCAGATSDFEGNLIVAGGNLGGRRGSRDINKFDAGKNEWKKIGTMNTGRWYPTVKALPNRDLLAIGGNSETVPLVASNPPTDPGAINFIPDVIRSDGNVRRLTNASSDENVNPNGPAWSSHNEEEHYYPWMFVAPNGKVFYAGPRNRTVWLDTGEGTWSNGVGAADGQYRKYGSSVMYDIGKILVLAGGPGDGTGGCPEGSKCGYTSSKLIDINSGTAQTLTGGEMKYKRVHANATVLPDGQVIVIGGSQNGNVNGNNFDDTYSVLESELWSPATNSFKPAATMQTSRNYHSTALLLPDGRVLSAGGGGCGTGCPQNHANAEIYYPPYLFKKDGSGQLVERPVITQAPDTASYGASFEISSPDATITKSAVLMHLGSATHAFDQGQARVPIAIERRGVGVLRLTAPANANIAPPGVYMLYIIDAAGVPSIAKMIKLQ